MLRPASILYCTITHHGSYFIPIFTLLFNPLLFYYIHSEEMKEWQTHGKNVKPVNIQ